MEKKEYRWYKNNIRVSSMVTAKVGEIKEKKRVGIWIRLRKDVVGYFQYVVGKKIF